jgi:rsbT antagonist protein RsbS
MTVSILARGPFLIASVQSALSDTELTELRDDLLAKTRDARARGIIIDATSLDVIDSFGARTLRQIAQTAGLSGARTVIAGIQPDIALAMAQLGLTLEGAATVLDLEEGLTFLRQRHGVRDSGLN